MKNITSILLLPAAILMLAACGGNKNVRAPEGTETTGSERTGTVVATSDASIVHVDLTGRIATIHNGNSFEEGVFLIVQNKEGKKTGVLKALAVRESGLRTADILEGRPRINHVVSAASASESEELAKIYRDPEQE